jgi:hypothetical protein
LDCQRATPDQHQEFRSSVTAFQRAEPPLTHISTGYSSKVQQLRIAPVLSSRAAATARRLGRSPERYKRSVLLPGPARIRMPGIADSDHFDVAPGFEIGVGSVLIDDRPTAESEHSKCESAAGACASQSGTLTATGLV